MTPRIDRTIPKKTAMKRILVHIVASARSPAKVRAQSATASIALVIEKRIRLIESLMFNRRSLSVGAGYFQGLFLCCGNALGTKVMLRRAARHPHFRSR